MTVSINGELEAAGLTAGEGSVGAKTTAAAAYGPKQTVAIELSSRLTDLITQEPHRFALHGDDQLTTACISALKGVFDLAVETETAAVPAIAATLRSALPSDEQDEARQRRKRKRRGDNAADVVAHRLFEPTPVGELTVEGMRSTQLWEQLELRNAKVCTLLDTVIVSDQMAEEEDSSEEEEDEDEATEAEEPLDDAERKLRRKRAKQTSEVETVQSLEQLSDAELRAVGIDPAHRAEFEVMAMDEDSDGDEDGEEEDEDAFGYPGASDLSDDDEYSGVIVKEPLLSEEEQQKRKAEIEAAERRQQMAQRRLARLVRRFNPSTGEGSDDEEDEDEEEEEEEDEDGDYGDESEDEHDAKKGKAISYLSSLLDEDDDDDAGRSNGISSNGTPVKHNAELDDDFFSIDQFNRDTDDYGDEGIDLGDDIDLFKSIDGGEDGEDEEDLPRYADFFAPPPFHSPRKAKPAEKATEKANDAEGMSRSSSVRFNEEVSIRHIKPRRQKGGMQISPELLQLLQADDGENDGSDVEDESEEEDEEDEDEVEMETDEDAADLDDDPTLVDQDEEELGEEGQSGEEEESSEEELSQGGSSDADHAIANRVAGDLFADDEEGEAGDDGQAGRSSHQRRLLALQQEIAQLERENVGKKDWTLMGEAGSRARPENSLLEEDVEFESNRKAKPVNTPETTQTIEEMIKKRILDDQFDDVQRRATLNPVDFLPSKMLELSDQKSARSLGELYEDELNGVEGQGSKLDKELQKEHEDIDRLYAQLESQLDALSNAHYTPKAPQVSIQTVSNAPTVTLEESLPTSMSHGTRLAPEEVYDSGAHNSTLEGASSELTPEEKRRRHRQLRDEKKARNERIAAHRQTVEINRQAFGQNRGGRFVGGAAQKSGGAAAEKDEALRKLMGNKGVSVVGKGSTANGQKQQQRASSSKEGGVNAASLKL